MHSREAVIKNYNIHYSQIVDPRLIADKGAQITVGDMHANSRKFLSILVKHGFLELTSEEQFKLSQIYNTDQDSLTKEQYDTYCEIILNAKVRPEAKEAILRLMGDEFADRGCGDHFTLPIIEKLSASGIQWSVCLSNHVISLIRCYEENWKFEATDAFPSDSIIELQKAIDRGLITRKKVNDIIKNYYLPHLTIADYTINENGQITHYLHAPFGDNSLVDIARQLGVEYDTTSVMTEKASLEHMQMVFQEEYVKKGKIHTLFDSPESESEDDFEKVLHEEMKKAIKPTAVSESVWNRKKSHLKRSGQKRYVNGHNLVTLGEIIPENVIELDNELGKQDFIFCFHERSPYKVYYAHESKEFKNPCFNEVDDLVVAPGIKFLFNEEMMGSLIKKDKIYSRVQIQCLKEFLCSDDSVDLWYGLLGAESRNYIKLMGCLNRNYELWDVLYLLKKHNLLDSISLNCMIDNSQNSEKIYQILLIFEDSDMLKPENNINAVLSCKHHLDLLYNYLIEYIEINSDSKSNTPFNDAVEGPLRLVDQAALYCDKVRALNTFYIIVPDSVDTLTSDNILEFIHNDIEIEDKNNRIVEYFNELKAVYLRLIEPSSSSTSEEDSNDQVNDENEINDESEIYHSPFDDDDLIIYDESSDHKTSDETDDEVEDKNEIENKDDLASDYDVIRSRIDNEFDLDIYYSNLLIYEGLLKKLNLSSVAISMSNTLLEFCTNKVALQTCFIQLFQSSFDKNFKLSTSFLNSLLSSTDMMNTVLVIWPLIKNKNINVFKTIFECDSVVSVFKFAEFIYATNEEISLDQLLLLSKSTKHQLDEMLSLSSLLKGKGLLDDDSFDFILNNPKLIHTCMACVKLYKHHLSKNIWDVLKSYSGQMDVDFVEYSRSMKAKYANSDQASCDKNIIADIHIFFSRVDITIVTPSISDTNLSFFANASTLPIVNSIETRVEFVDEVKSDKVKENKISNESIATNPNPGMSINF